MVTINTSERNVQSGLMFLPAKINNDQPAVLIGSKGSLKKNKPLQGMAPTSLRIAL